MRESLSIIRGATRADVRTDPFPHLVLHNALPEELYAELAASFPDPKALGVDTRKNNERWNYFAYKVAKNPSLSPLWRDFIAYHASQAFYDELIELFHEDICALYPHRFPNKAALAKRAGTRKLADFANASVLLDAMISGNTPVTTAGSVRTSHLDLGDKLFSGLFYMRPDDYDAIGGDLTISRFRPEYDTAEKRNALFDGAYVDDRHLETVTTVPYAKNTVVLFVNSLDSVHGVTVRQPSDKSRLFVNLVVQVDPPLYLLHEDGRPAEYTAADYVSPRAKGDGFIKAIIRKLRAA
ncbi:hypothetical protein [Methylopila sp. M107]|uniref:hypothetical protein n=1 Tax=Methylopila sp. M107 TaxID=1101190 RepID=UPI00036E6B01|nr:hypothetical protein [Methylopila sp. M107]